MKKRRDPHEPFAFTRVYALVSLVAVLATAAALAILYRDLSIRTIVEFGEQSNVTVATTVLDSVLPKLAAYLAANESGSAVAPTHGMPPRLLGLIAASMRDTPIERIHIHNRNGIVLYSSQAHEIGSDESANPRFQGAMAGKVRSELHYRDVFNIFDRASAKDNLIETYVPIRQPGIPAPLGVFEIYTDVSPMVRAMVHNELLILAGITVIMMILYGLLLYVVRRSDKVIKSQRQTILERNETLEVLSARMLATEESERRHVAWELHEEIAQTLCAVKMKVEALARASAQRLSRSGPTSSDEIVPLIQDAIRDVRALAMDLRPPTLDDFGLVATTRALCQEAEQASGQVEVSSDITVHEEDIPDALKSVIFRVVQQTLKRLVRTPGISEIRVSLTRAEGLHLSVEFGAGTLGIVNGATPIAPEEPPITELWERAVLAGGSFSTMRTAAGRSLYQASWIL
jgi:signal transduction histidine kinase